MQNSPIMLIVETIQKLDKEVDCMDVRHSTDHRKLRRQLIDLLRNMKPLDCEDQSYQTWIILRHKLSDTLDLNDLAVEVQPLQDLAPKALN